MMLPGWRALGITWAVALAVVGGGVLWLNHLGPLQELAGGEDTAPAAAQLPNGARDRSAASPYTDAPTRGSTVPGATAQGGLTPPAAEARPESQRDPGGPAAETAPDRLAAAAPPRADGTRAPDVTASVTPRVVPGLDPALSEPGRYGPLPRISADGRTPIRVYGRPFDRTDSRPRIAIIIGDFGLNASQSDDALRRLPAAVSLAITPYGYGLPAWSERARERGVETLMGIPMEPAGFPMNDPGDRALLTTLPTPENLDRLSWTLARTQGYAGAIGAIGGMRGERFAQSSDAFPLVQESLRSRGLLYIDPRPGVRNPSRAWGRTVDIVLDEPATRGEIQRRLTALEALARERGSALGLAGSPTPVVVDRIAAWAETLDAKGLVLAPASVLIRRPDGLSETTSRTQ